MTNTPPKCFISYSWTSPEHQKWVLDLAEDLTENGVLVVIDKWDLKEGHDSLAFMEMTATDESITKVVLVCDKAYAEKADKRTGGAGTEAQIISPQIYERIQQDKFVAVVCEYDDQNRPLIPSYYRGRIWIDMSSEQMYSGNFEQLVRWIYNKPSYTRPKLGQTPAYILDNNLAEPKISVNSQLHKRTLSAIREHKLSGAGILQEYCEQAVEILNRSSLLPTELADDGIITAISDLTNYRNDIVEVFQASSRFDPTGLLDEVLCEFFERLGSRNQEERTLPQDRLHDDIRKFIRYELFICCVAIFLRAGRFATVEKFLTWAYIIGDEHGGFKSRMFTEINDRPRSFEKLNNQLEQRKISFRAHILKTRCSNKRVSFDEIMQADFVLFLRSGMQLLMKKNCEHILVARHLSLQAPLRWAVRNLRTSFIKAVL